MMTIWKVDNKNSKKGKLWKPCLRTKEVVLHEGNTYNNKSTEKIEGTKNLGKKRNYESCMCVGFL